MKRSVAAALVIALVTTVAAPAAPEPISPRMLQRLHDAVLAPGGYADEAYDDGLPPAQTLRSASLEAPTPSTVPGAKTILTGAVRDLLVSRQPYVLLDVTGATTRSLPAAVYLKGAGLGTSFDDDVQPRLAKKLAELTGGKPVPVVVFSQGPSSWLAYNVALRLVKLGATVLWYRGGHHAWLEAKLPQVRVTPEPW